MNDVQQYEQNEQQPKGYLIDPFKLLYGDHSLVSKTPAIQETLQAAIDVNEDRLDLNPSYRKHLRQLYSLSYVPLGCINWIDKFTRAYQKEHKYSSFEQYCIHELGKCVDAVDNSIEAARVCLELIIAGYEYEELPNNMSQACALKKFTGPELIEKWEYVLDNLERHQRTATAIKELLFPKKVSTKTINTTVKLPVDVYSRLIEVAYKGKVSICQAIQCVVFLLTDGFKKSDIKRLCKWVLDMVDLTSKPNDYQTFE